VLAASLLTACGGNPVAVDADDSPEDVVRTYLTALQDGDTQGADGLTTGSYSGNPFTTDPPRIEDVEISPATPESTVGTAGEGHADAVFVPVTFDLHGADATMPDGPTDWGYVLVRDGDDEPWLIASSGSI